MLRARLALAAGLMAIAIAAGLVLSRAPLVLAGSNGVPANFAVAFINGNRVICQAGGTIPAGTQAIRVSLSVNIGPSVSLEVQSNAGVVTQGAHPAGWGVDETVTVPVRRVAHTVAGLRICTTIGPSVEPIQVNGVKLSTGTGSVNELLRMEYLRPGPSSWLSLVPSVAHDIGVAHAPSGSSFAYLVIVLMLGVCALAWRAFLRELR
jgi:hypothetical protein